MIWESLDFLAFAWESLIVRIISWESKLIHLERVMLWAWRSCFVIPRWSLFSTFESLALGRLRYSCMMIMVSWWVRLESSCLSFSFICLLIVYFIVSQNQQASPTHSQQLCYPSTTYLLHSSQPSFELFLPRPIGFCHALSADSFRLILSLAFMWRNISVQNQEKDRIKCKNGL